MMRTLSALTAALALAVPAGAAATPGKVKHMRIAGQRAVVLRPPEPNGRLVLYVHGVTERADDILEDGLKAPLIDALLDRGDTIASSDAHGDNWGNRASVADYRRLAKRVRHRELAILAQSAGGLGAVQLLRWLDPATLTLIYPVCNLRSIRRLGRFTAQIDASGAPVSDLSPVRPPAVGGLPVTITASPADTIVPKRSNADVCARLFRRHGAHVTRIRTHGDHGHPSNFRIRRLLRAI